MTERDNEKKVQGRRFCFTLNNFTEEEDTTLRVPDTFQYIKFQHEIAPTTGTPHIQGYIETKKKVMLTTKKHGKSTGFHAQPGCARMVALMCKGSAHANQNYVSKPGGTNPHEDGEPMDAGAHGKAASAELWDQIKLSARAGDFDAIPSKTYLNIRRNLKDEHREYRTSNPRKRKIDALALRPHQAELYEKLMVRASKTGHIIVIVDPRGQSGKSHLAKYTEQMHPDIVQVLKVNTHQNMAKMMQEHKHIYFIDIGRTAGHKFEWDFAEDLADGHVSSGKYDVEDKHVEEPAHVVVLCNSYREDSLSVDRVTVINWS